MKDNYFSLKWLLSQNWNVMVNVIWKLRTCAIYSFIMDDAAMLGDSYRREHQVSVLIEH